MSQNITWLGASYSDVPAVTLPKTGGGTARFTDVTDTTATTADVAQGKYFFAANGTLTAGTASGGGGDSYTLTTVVPQQNFTATDYDGSYQTVITSTGELESGESYLVTFDGDEYLCECGIIWGSEYMAGALGLFWGDHSDTPYPFGLDYSGGDMSVGAYDLNQHTIKVEHLEFVDGPLNLIAKSVTANGTYTASSDNADGYSSVTVNVASPVKTATGTFTGNGTRTIDVTCAFEPDLVYVTSDPGSTASSGTVAAIIVRDLMTATRYRNNATTNSHYAIPDITDLNTNGSSYSWRATYDSTNSKLTLYCFSNNARALLTSGRTYTYKFVKWT